MSRRQPASRSSAAAYLASRVRYGIKFGLETTRAIVEGLDHPEATYPVLLVAGTNGKGSVVAYVDSILRASGLRAGRYTSPHLVRLNERIVVDGREISDAALEAAVGRVRETAGALVAGRVISGHPTFFEALTAAAFEHFRREGVDVAVLEVGMGGRLDATNVSAPLASAIVSIDRDHEKFLGDTLASIAREKAGVLRAGRSTVVGPLPREAEEAIAREAASAEARLVPAYAGVEMRDHGDGRLDVQTPTADYEGLRPLPGDHQRDNLVVALRLLDEARAAGLRVDPAATVAGVAATSWPGRLEWIPGAPSVLLDGAHNPAGARALAAYMKDRAPFVLLFGVMRDKDVSELARILFPLARAVVLTRPRVPRAASPSEIAERAGSFDARVHHEADPRKALALARRLAAQAETVVVAGSLYLVGEVRAMITSGPPRRSSFPRRV